MTAPLSADMIEDAVHLAKVAINGREPDARVCHELASILEQMRDIALRSIGHGEAVAWLVQERDGRPMATTQKPRDEDCSEYELSVTPLYTRAPAEGEGQVSVSVTALKELLNGLENQRDNAVLRGDEYDVGYLGAMIQHVTTMLPSAPAQPEGGA